MLKTKQHIEKCYGYFLFIVNLTRLTPCYLQTLWFQEWCLSEQAGMISVMSEVKNNKHNFPKTFIECQFKKRFCLLILYPPKNWPKNTKIWKPQQQSMQKTQIYCCASNYLQHLMYASVPFSFSTVPPEWQNMCERWHWTCSPQTKELQEPYNNDNDNTQPCLHCCEVSITGRLGAWLLPVSLTGRGATGGGKAWRTSTPTRVVGKHLGQLLYLTPL